MQSDRPQFLNVGSGASKRRIAYRVMPPAEDDGLSLIWLPGLKSDMNSTKATALKEWVPQQGLGLTRFEYSAHGDSDGDFLKATIGDWLEETRILFDTVTSGPQILVGSSTGGHIALVLLRQLLRQDPQSAERIKALVLIAPAWDLTEELMWKKFDAGARQDLMEKGVYYQPNDYGEPYAITRHFIEEGRNHLLKREPFDPGRPIVILQGLQDEPVPPEHTRELKSFLTGGWVELNEVADGDHSLSRPEDLQLLFAKIEELRTQL